jgi:hypothetical protein
MYFTPEAFDSCGAALSTAVSVAGAADASCALTDTRPNTSNDNNAKIIFLFIKITS